VTAEGGETKPTEGEGTKTEEVPKEEDEDDKLMTLDEYLKKKQEKGPAFTLPPPRRVEGQANPEWSKFVPLQREEEELKVQSKAKKSTGDEKKTKGGDTTTTTKKEKVAVDEVFKIQEDAGKRQQRGDRDRDRRDFNNNNTRGGRGGGRGGRGGGRGGRGQQTPDINETNFPALSTKA